MEIGSFVLDAQHVAGMDVARGLGFHFIRADATEIAGLGCKCSCLEEASSPEPLVDAYRLFLLFGSHVSGEILGSGFTGFQDSVAVEVAGGGDVETELSSGAVES